ncbi:hypothetical protein Peur_023168 [Populus x canadensis]
MILPLIKPPTDPIPSKDSPASRAGVRFLARADADSASPSASNPVLRLMGKNLMVANKEDNSLLAINIRNQDSNSFHHMTPQGSVIFHTRQWFNVRMLGSPIGQTSPYRGVSSLHLVGWIFTSPVPSSYPSLRF